MDDYTDLIARLRTMNGIGDIQLNELMNRKTPLEAAGAIEDQGKRIAELEAQLAALAKQEPVAWYVDDEEGREYNGAPKMSNGRTGFPLYARPVPADPVNARLVEALKRCRFDSFNMSLADLEFCRSAIAAAEAQQAEPALPASKTHGDSHAWLAWALHIIRERCPDVLTSHQYDCASKALAAGYAKVPVRLTDEQIDAAEDEAYESFRRSRGGCRGQIIMPSDSPDWHLAKAVEKASLRANGFKVED